jgi:hypothetical protein
MEQPADRKDEMGFLNDVRRTHVYRNQARTQSSTHVLHPFLNVKGPNRDRSEVLRTLDRKQKKSAHVTYEELVEMFAHGCFEQFNIRLRMKPADGSYPGSAPALHPHDEDVVPGSAFAAAVARVDTRSALTPGVGRVLGLLGVGDGSTRTGMT